ncbi:MAG: hypothetical protein ACOC6G_02970 [Thermoproteota archaeon]
MRQSRLFKVKAYEERNLCALCQGHRNLCGKSVCPILVKAKAIMKLEEKLLNQNMFGSSPPAVFVGSRNYPKVLAGPLVPPISMEDTAIMDLPELWVDKTFNEILGYRFSLVRGKAATDVTSAQNPNKDLSIFQEMVMASQPTDTEMWFKKKPRFSLAFSAREAPWGPTAYLNRTVLTENPQIPQPVDYVVSDTDLKAEQGILKLYDSGINQRQITRMFSVGLLGVEEQRRLVPTEWSITAVDDILGKMICKQIKRYPRINQFRVLGYKALANNVQILLLPSSWMFEAQEAWLISQNPTPAVNYELTKGRKSYAEDLAGAYYAARLPVLEHLRHIRRQAGALVFMEVYPGWIPLGVWRFREICRKALKKEPTEYPTLEEALKELRKRLQLPLQRWLDKSRILRWFNTQTELTAFLDK